MTAKRILIVIYNLQKGGAERVVTRLSHQWIRQGHAVTLALFDVRNPAYDLPPEVKIIDIHTRYKPSPYMLVKLVTKGWFTLVSARRLARHIASQRYDHMIGFMEEAGVPLIFAGCLTASLGRIVVSVRNSPSHIVWVYRRVLMPLLYRLPRRIVAVSADIKKQLGAMGIPASKIDFIPNPAPLLPQESLFRPTQGGDYILAMGRLHRQKGFDLLLRAYSRLATPAPDLAILGEGEERDALTEMAESLGIGDRVHLIGEVPHPEHWHAHAELFVLSSRYEGWPNVILEAMAFGCAVVSFDCPTGPAEIIAHGKNGWLVANGDVEALTEGMAKVLHDTKLRQQLCKAGKARAKEFDIAKLAPLWLKP